MTNTDKNRDELSEVQRRVRGWVKAYAGDAVPEEQATKLADRLSMVAAEWARCGPEKEQSFLQKIKAELLNEFDPSTRKKPAASCPPSALFAQACLGHSLVIKGELTGSESILIDGRVEGSISLPGNCVMIGRNAVVAANIYASEIVIFGKVTGNLTATDRVDIRSDASLTGDIVAQRISIEDGAFFKGGIDIRKDATAIAKSAEKADQSVAARLVRR